MKSAEKLKGFNEVDSKQTDSCRNVHLDSSSNLRGLVILSRKNEALLDSETVSQNNKNNLLIESKGTGMGPSMPQFTSID